MSGARLAALHLATLTRKDRRWLLAQLSRPERSALGEHMQDAMRMAPARLSEIIEEVSDRRIPTQRVVPGGSEPANLDGIAADRLNPFLDRLPQAAVAAIAVRGERQWGVRYLGQKGPLSRRRFSQLASLAERRVTPAFLDRFEALIAKQFDVGGQISDSRFEQVLRNTDGSGPR